MRVTDNNGRLHRVVQNVQEALREQADVFHDEEVVVDAASLTATMHCYADDYQFDVTIGNLDVIA